MRPPARSAASAIPTLPVSRNSGTTTTAPSRKTAGGNTPPSGNEAFFSRGRPGRGAAPFFSDRAHAPLRPVRAITSPPLFQFALASVLLVTAYPLNASDL